MARTILNLAGEVVKDTMWYAPEGEVILSAEEHAFRVCSDNAMIDSGSGFIVTTWTGSEVKRYEVHTGRGQEIDMPTPDANALERHLAQVWSDAKAFVRCVFSCAEQAHFICANESTVEVVNGRKCPKGKYEVVAHAQGAYGPYVNLRSLEGKFYSYISVKNVKVVPNYARQFLSGNFRILDFVAMPKWIVPFACAIVTEGAQAGIGILADAIEERAEIISGSSATDFANALRTIAQEKAEYANKLSTYYADCHNEFRKPFAGI